MMMQAQLQTFPGRAPRSLTIVVADPATEVRLVLQEWLEQLGHIPLGVESGNEAMRLIRERTVDVVITEVIMPNGDGLEVILELKKRQPAAHIIAISGGGRYLPAADCLKVARGLGAHSALTKPLQRRDLVDALEKFLRMAAV